MAWHGMPLQQEQEVGLPCPAGWSDYSHTVVWQGPEGSSRQPGDLKNLGLL